MLRIAVAVREALLIEELPEKVDTFIGFTITYKHRECYYCGYSTFYHHPLEIVLHRNTRFNAWCRRTAHSKCVISSMAKREAMYQRPAWAIEKLRLTRRNRSARVLLLLEEAGLCRDVAWVIAALSCWVLRT
jgi:hypothetical protein